MDVREGRGGGGEEQPGGIFGDLSSLSPTGVSSSHFCPQRTLCHMELSTSRSLPQNPMVIIFNLLGLSQWWSHNIYNKEKEIEDNSEEYGLRN